MSSAESSSGAAGLPRKVVICGNGSAGKTSVCARLLHDGFQRVYKQTTGIDWYEKTLKIRDKTVLLQLHDIGGQSMSSGMIQQYLSGADILFLLYDVTDAQSFRDLEDWWATIQRVRSSAAAGGTGVLNVQRAYLLGNKVDLIHLRKVTEAQHEDFIRGHGLAGGWLVSARTGEAIGTAFQVAAARSVGVELSPSEIASTERVIVATITAASGEEVTRAGAAEIEAADREFEARKAAAAAAAGCTCCLQ